MKLNIILMIAGAALFSMKANADTIQCSNLTVTEVVVEANRDDTFPLEDKVVVKFAETCAGVNLGYIDNTHIASLHFLQLATAAKTTGTKVNLALNTNSGAIWNRTVNPHRLIAYPFAYLTLAN